MLRKTVLLLLTIALLAPSIHAHGSPTPIEAEDLVLEDERTDSGPGFFWNGFDINYVYVREAHMFGVDGIVIRWFVWGGNLDEGTAPSHSLELAMDGLDPLTWSTDDNGASWTFDDAEDACGQAEVLELEREADSFADEPGPKAYDVQFQTFIPLCMLGVSIGDSLGAMTATSFADGQRVDAAPGGFYNPNTPDQELTDPMNNEARGRLMDSLLLDGADRYTKSNVSYTDGVVTVEVQNLIWASGQHIFAKSSLEPDTEGHEHDESGNHVAGGFDAEPGQPINFTIPVSDFDVIQVYVETDLGGRETFWVRNDGAVSRESLDALNTEPVETPGVPVVLVAIALVGLAAVRRRDA